MGKEYRQPPVRLTKAQIRETLESVPIESVLIGATKAKGNRLTPKQRRFAELVAQGESKAGAYRGAYDTQAAPHHQSLEGQRLAANPAIARQIEALRLAAEASRYATPAALRALVIERLTATAIDEDVKPAQRLRALELLGKVTEVAAFTERREIIKTTDPAQARAALLDSLRSAIKSSAVDVEPLSMSVSRRQRSHDADADVMSGNRAMPGTPPPASANAGAADPGTGTPRDRALAGAEPLLSNPHTQPPPFDISPSPSSGSPTEDPPSSVDN
jgi:hypothetical protein